jgi:hypothetical protein
MNPDDWRAERKLSNGRVRVRHIPTRCLFDLWVQDGEVRVVLRQGAAGNELFEEVKAWFRKCGKDQPNLL